MESKMNSYRDVGQRLDTKVVNKIEKKMYYYVPYYFMSISR